MPLKIKNQTLDKVYDIINSNIETYKVMKPMYMDSPEAQAVIDIKINDLHDLRNQIKEELEQA